MLSTEPRTRAELVARYRAVRDRLNTQPQPVKTVLVPREKPDITFRRRLIFQSPVVASLGCWIVNRRAPVIPLHLQNSIKRIQVVVAKEFGVNLSHLVSQRRTAHMVMARQVAMWFCREKTDRSLPAIGEAFGGRDHTTVLHAIRQIERKRHIEPELAEAIERIALAL